jgi:putative selenium metabolism protein SsnA
MILFTNASLVEFDPPRVRHNEDVLVEGDSILQTGKGLDTSGVEKTIDVSGKLLFPGIVCSHTHFYSGLSRGIMANIGSTPDFVSILKNLWWRLDRALDKDSLRASGLICSLDAIRAGTTAVIDHHASPNCISGSLEVLKNAFEKTGLRAATCYEVTDRHGEKALQEGLDENIAFAGLIDEEKKAGTWSGLTEAHVGGHAPCTLPDSALERLAAACERAGRGFHVHLAEDAWDVSHSHITYGKDLVFRLDEYGLVTDKSILVHGVHLNPEEIGRINERGAFLVHNSRSNMNNGVGYNPHLPGLTNWALGTDGIGSDMFAEMQCAYFKHKDEKGPLWPGDFLSALAAGNRLLEKSFGRPFGRIDPGYAADLVLADYAAPSPLEPENIAGHMVFGMGSNIVETVMINGKIVMENRVFPGTDRNAVYREASAQAQRLWARINTIEA